jgi:ubiquinone biosynthesis protein UbiJ
MFATLALAAFERLLNDWIDLDAATRLGFDQLAVPASKLLRVVIDSPRLSVDVIFDQGRVRLAPTALGQDDTPQYSVFEQRPYDKAHAPTKATTTLHVPHLVALAALVGAEAGSTGNIPLQGDMALLQALQKILAAAEPDVAGALAPLMGDTAAQYIGGLLTQGRKALLQTAQTFRANSEEWVTQDSELFAAGWRNERFVDQMQDVNADVERLQARVARLRGLQEQQQQQ